MLCAKCEQRRPIAIEIENPLLRENLVMTSAYARLPVRTDTGGRGGEMHAGSPIHEPSVCLEENLTSSDATNRFTPLTIRHLLLKMYLRQRRKRQVYSKLHFSPCNQMQKYWKAPMKTWLILLIVNSLPVTHLWNKCMTPIPPSIEGCYSEFWASLCTRGGEG